MPTKPAILVVISFMVIALIYGPLNAFYVFSSSQLDEVAPEAAPTPPSPPPPIGLPKIGGGAAPSIGGEAAEQPTAPGADEGTAAAPVNPGTSPTGWCMDVPGSPECIPCDPGTSGSDPEAGGGLGCVPQECWSPFGGLNTASGECGCEELPQGGIECEYGAPQVPLQQLETAPSRVVPPIAEEIQETPPEPLPEADQGTASAPRTVEPLTRTCPVGNVWDPEWMICVPDVPPLELCPDGSIPQPTGGPGGTQPECPPPSDAQQLRADQPEEQEPGQPEEPQAAEEQQSSAEEGDGSEESSNSN
jgi:hypothetical protein